MEYRAEIVRSYSEMREYVTDFARADGYRFLVVIGGPGLGKSRMFREVLKQDVLTVEGRQTPFSVYLERVMHFQASLPVEPA